MILENFYFLRPGWLLALVPTVILWWMSSKRSRRLRGWPQVCDPRLLPHITETLEGGAQKIRLVLTLAALLSILALAGPTWDRSDTDLQRDQSALVILLDLSRSMDVQDIPESRLKRALNTLEDLLMTDAYAQTALVAFAGEAFLVCPLTSDASMVALQLEAMATGIMPVPGTRTDLALGEAMKSLAQAGIVSGDLLLVTDSAFGHQLENELSRLKNAGHSLSVWAVGTSLGAPIPTPAGYLKDDLGNIVVPQLNEEFLQGIARKCGGVYASLDHPGEAVARTVKFAQGGSHSFMQAGKNHDVEVSWRDRGPYLLLLVIVLAAAQCRRGLFVLLIFLALPAPPAFAWGGPDFLRTPDQRAAELFAAGDYEAAAQTFEDPDWKAAAYYRNGNWLEAEKIWGTLETADASYNRGNALAQLGRLDEALQAYAKALQLNPSHDDARHNLQALERFKHTKDNPTSSSSQPMPKAVPSAHRSGKQADSVETALSDEIAENSSRRAEKSQAGIESQSGAGISTTYKNSGTSDSEKATDSHPDGIPTEKQIPDRTQIGASSDGSLPQSLRQLLDQVPDDPTGLLRRRFDREQRRSAPAAGEPTW